MGKCPKCNKKLRLTDISQFCPSCGVNMRFYNFEENFIREAKLAELSQAGLKVKLRNLKYSFSGSKYITAKLVVMLLPLVSLLIPSGNISISAPFISFDAHFGILGIVNIVTGGALNYLLSMGGSDLVGDGFSALTAALVVFAVTAVFAVFSFLFSFLGFISIKNMQKLTTIVSGLGIITAILSLVSIAVFNAKTENNLILSGSFGYGLIVTVVMFAAVFYVNLMLWKKGIHPIYDEGVEERVRIYKELKAGKINIDDLPQPVVETEATRKIDEEIAKEEKLFFESMKNKGKEE